MARSLRKERQRKRLLRIIHMFSPGYDPRATVFNVSLPRVHSREQGASAEEAFFEYESTGKLISCNDPDGFAELRERKACMDLTVSMWKEEMREIARDFWKKKGTRWPAFLILQSLFTDGFPASFLWQIGLPQIIGITLREFGRYMSATRRLN